MSWLVNKNNVVSVCIVNALYSYFDNFKYQNDVVLNCSVSIYHNLHSFSVQCTCNSRGNGLIITLTNAFLNGNKEVGRLSKGGKSIDKILMLIFANLHVHRCMSKLVLVDLIVLLSCCCKYSFCCQVLPVPAFAHNITWLWVWL